MQILAELLEVNVSQAEVDKERRRFCSQRYFFQEEQFTDWLAENDLTIEEFNELMYEMARCRRLQNWLLTRKSHEKNTKILLDELRLQNRYKECADAAAQREQVVQEHYPNVVEENYNDLTILQLAVDHQRFTGSQLSLNEDWVNEAGFLAHELLKLELLRSHLARKAMQNVKSGSSEV
jgi:FKBP-type peptidyl-prolyl cis-trans isomerase (trigger factor)